MFPVDSEEGVINLCGFGGFQFALCRMNRVIWVYLCEKRQQLLTLCKFHWLKLLIFEVVEWGGIEGVATVRTPTKPAHDRYEEFSCR